jgi:hypothetical protein
VRLKAPAAPNSDAFAHAGGSISRRHKNRLQILQSFFASCCRFAPKEGTADPTRKCRNFPFAENFSHRNPKLARSNFVPPPTFPELNPYNHAICALLSAHAVLDT